MSLFVVNRYLGEEEDDRVTQSQSEALLAKLQQKAKERQKKSLREQKVQNDQQIQKRKAAEDSCRGSQLPKKRKVEKTPTVPQNQSDADRPERLVDRKIKKKKPKKQSGNAIKTPSDTVEAEKDGQQDVDREKEEETENNTSKENSVKNSAPTGFTFLGGFDQKPVQKVHRILPQWLAQPDVIHRDIKQNLVPVCHIKGLSDHLLMKLQNNGIQHFFPVQTEVIPAILDSARQGLLTGRGGYRPRDICVSAPTGSGKTLAFVIPVVQVLMDRVVREVRALVVLPTKELAVQVFKVFTSYTEGSTLRVVVLAGQRSFAAERASLTEHRAGMRRSLADIVVATPGRLVDHINDNSGFSLEHLRFLIIDEADRMIDSMHQSWLSQVLKAVYRSGGETTSVFKRTEPTPITASSLSPPQMPLQKLLFSATLTQNPEKLQQLGLYHPRLFSSAHSCSKATPSTQERFNFPEALTEYYVPCTLSKKPLLVLHFILHMKLRPVLCFTNSRETAHRLFLLVQLFGGVQAAEFSSRLSPPLRKKMLKEFQQGKIQLLISTDAAARGIDISGVKCVLNYDAPQYIRTYIHRIGRTARAGKAGLAFTFLLGVQEKNFLQMVHEAGSPGIQKHIVKPTNLQSMEARYEQTLQELSSVIKDEKSKS